MELVPGWSSRLELVFELALDDYGVLSRVSVVIPTWNRADLLRSILLNLQEQTVLPDEVVVIDNGSQDHTASVAKEFAVRLIAFPENRGFAVAVNEGIGQALGDWIFILNNDVVLRPDWLEVALRSAMASHAEFVVGKLLRPDESGEIDGSWDLISRGSYAWRCGYGKPDGVIWSTARKVHFAPMTAALFHRAVFERVGLLETRFESYYEDVEFGIRCALAGVEGLYEPAAVATHISKTSLGKSSFRVYFLTARNQVYILAKYYSTSTLRRFAWAIAIGQILSLAAAARQRNLWAGLQGKWAGLRNWAAFRSEAAGASAKDVQSVFRNSEREIFDIQQQVGFDAYWRLYFKLVRPK